MGPPTGYTPRYAIGLARPEDDLDLQDFLDLSTLPGDISLVLARSPSFFSAGPIMGDVHQTVVIRDSRDGPIVAMAERSERLLYVDGTPRRVGYLSSARILPGHRGGSLLARGYRFIRQLHEQGTVETYISTIASDNHVAKRLLTSGRAGLPPYEPLGALVTLLFPTRHGAAIPHPADLETVAGCPASLGDILGFINRNGPRRQLFPVVTIEDLSLESGLLKGLRADDFVVARRGGKVVGVVGTWDQRPYKQIVVSGYGWRMKLLKPAYNALAPLLGKNRIPPVGSRVESHVLTLLTTEDDDTAVLAILLDAALKRSASLGATHAGLCLMENDPLLQTARRFRPFIMRSNLYLVGYDRELVQRRIPKGMLHLEAGTL